MVGFLPYFLFIVELHVFKIEIEGSRKEKRKWPLSEVKDGKSP